MSKMKRLLTLILAAAIILQTGAFAVSGESAESDGRVITISNIDTSQLAGGSAVSPAASTVPAHDGDIFTGYVSIFCVKMYILWRGRNGLPRRRFFR